MKLDQIVKAELLKILEETFSKHHGIYTNRNTSLFETLEAISAEAASVEHGAERETIAGHVFHVKFYLIVAQEYITNVRTGKTDWDLSWVVKGVTETQWAELKDQLRVEYRNLVSFIEGIEDWEKEDYFVGILGIVAHNAFHLGAIRELNSV